jgi:glycosyltransferase involved in cell wall biosynthesis
MTELAPPPLRILLVSFVGDNRWSGMGKWTHSIADCLAELGHKPSLWFLEDFPQFRNRWRWAVLLFPPVLAWRIWKRRGDFDVVVIHEPSGFWYGLMRRIGCHIPPMIAMCHNVESKHQRELVEYASHGLAVVPWASRLKVPLFRRWQSDGAIRLADHAICLSSVDREYLLRRLKLPSQRVTVMMNGVSPEPFCAKRKSGRGRVLFVGGWLDVKGRRVLPGLWSKVRARISTATLTIVGAGLSPEIVLRDFASEDRVSITVISRLTSEPELLAQYAEHDLFLMPSLSEGSSLALLEAMAAGLPVVATAVGGNPDIVTHGVSGLLFAPGDSDQGAAHICRLLEDSATAARLGRAGHERARLLSWHESCRALISAVAVVGGQRPVTTQSAVKTVRDDSPDRAAVDQIGEKPVR